MCPALYCPKGTVKGTEDKWCWKWQLLTVMPCNTASNALSGGWRLSKIYAAARNQQDTQPLPFSWATAWQEVWLAIYTQHRSAHVEHGWGSWSLCRVLPSKGWRLSRRVESWWNPNHMPLQQPQKAAERVTYPTAHKRQCIYAVTFFYMGAWIYPESQSSQHYNWAAQTVPQELQTVT